MTIPAVQRQAYLETLDNLSDAPELGYRPDPCKFRELCRKVPKSSLPTCGTVL